MQISNRNTEDKVNGYDTKAPFMITRLVDGILTAVGYFWRNPDIRGVNLFNHWTKITLYQATIFQKDTYYESRDMEDIVSCE